MTDGPGEESQGHPAWQSILDQLPDDLQPLIRPELEKWDQSVSGKLQEARSAYEGFDPYKPLVENNVPMERIQQALWLAHQLDENPQGVVEQAIKAFDLGYVPRSEVVTPPVDDSNDEGYEDFSMESLEKNPIFLQYKEKADKIEEALSAQQQKEEEAEAATAFEKYLTELHETHGDFDDLYVTALMSQGADPVSVISGYQETIKAAAAAMLEGTKPDPVVPIVMGEEGTSGSGLAQENTRMGSLSNGQTNDLVLEFLKNNQAQSTG